MEHAVCGISGGKKGVGCFMLNTEVEVGLHAFDDLINLTVSILD